jgi:hypothetical protein
MSDGKVQDEVLFKGAGVLASLMYKYRDYFQFMQLKIVNLRSISTVES